MVGRGNPLRPGRRRRLSRRRASRYQAVGIGRGLGAPTWQEDLADGLVYRQNTGRFHGGVMVLRETLAATSDAMQTQPPPFSERFDAREVSGPADFGRASGLDFSGLVRSTDLSDPQREHLLDDMSKFHALWLPLGTRHRPDVPWPLHALQQWSRQWEYPYAFHHLRHACKAGARVLDAGSGITFFSFYLALHSFQVQALDADPSLVNAYTQINAHLPEACGVDFTSGNLTDLPYGNDDFAAVCCLSVFEHMLRAERLKCAREFARVLTPGGLLVITCDIELDGHAPGEDTITTETFPGLFSMFSESFELVFPLRPNPNPAAQLLRTDNYREVESYRLPWNQTPQGILKRARYTTKRLLGRREFRSVAVGALLLRKK